MGPGGGPLKAAGAGPGGSSSEPLRPQADRLSAATAAIPKRIIGRQKTKDTPRRPRNSIADGVAKARFCRKTLAAHLMGLFCSRMSQRRRPSPTHPRGPGGAFGDGQPKFVRGCRAPLAADAFIRRPARFARTEPYSPLTLEIG
jgi:hypothetical protein